MLSFDKYFVPTDKQKRWEWMKVILDSNSLYYASDFIQNRRYEYWKVQQRIRGEINRGDFEYIWNTWGLGPKPMQFINYPLLETHIDGLVGQFLSSPLQYDVWKVNENAVSEKMDMKTKLAFMKLAEPYLKKIEETMGVNLPMEERMKNLPPSVQKFETYDIRDMMEEAIFYDLYDLILRYKIQGQLGNSLNDICENGFAFGKICYDGNNPYMRQVPIINAICDLPLTSEPFSDTTKHNILGEDRYMNLEEIFDNYEGRLDEKDMDKIKTEADAYAKTSVAKDGSVYQNYFLDTNTNEVYMRVVDLQVRAYTNKQFVTRAKEDDEELDRVPRESKNMKEVRCGLKIGKDTYKEWKKEKQIPYKDNYSDLQLDYFGVWTKSNLYRKGWGFQMLYNVINMNIESLVNQAGGKALRVNTGNLPENIGVDDVPYYAKVLGVIPEQPQPGSSGSALSGEIDTGLGVGFQYMLSAKKVVEDSMHELTGVSPERLGQGSPYQSKELGQQNLMQSTTVTQPIFFAHTQFLEMGLQKMSDLIKYLHAKDELRSTVIGDMGLQVFQTTEDMSNYDYGIYVKAFAQDAQKNAKIEAVMQQAIATNPDLADAAIQMINAINSKEKQKIVESALAYIRKQKEGAAQHEQQVGQLQTQVLQQKAANDTLRAQAARYTAIDVQQLKMKGQTEDKLLDNYLDERSNRQQQGANRDEMLMQHAHEDSQQENEQQEPAAQPSNNGQ